MNCYNLQKNAFPACEEMRGSIPIADQNDGPVFCPKPRRAGILINLPIRPVKWHLGQQGEGSDSKVGAELLDIVLKRERLWCLPKLHLQIATFLFGMFLGLKSCSTFQFLSKVLHNGPQLQLRLQHVKESYGEEFANQIPSSPPYFCGSPPVRASNPLIQDARFGDEEYSLVSTISSPSGLLSPSSASRKAGCARMKFGLKPAAVRVEGFDCLSRDCQNSGIPAVA